MFSFRILFITLSLFCLGISFNTFAQKALNKPPITVSTFRNWPNLGFAEVTKDGRYIAYTINNEATDSRMLVIKPIDCKWERQYTGDVKGNFEDDKYFSFQTATQQKTGLRLDDNTEVTIPATKHVPVPKKEIEIYNSLVTGNRLIIEQTRVKRTDSLEGVNSYIHLAEKGAMVVVIKTDSQPESIVWYDIKSRLAKTLWQCATSEEEITIDNSNSQFLNHVLFQVKSPAPPIVKGMAEVDVWTYHDVRDPEPYAERETHFITKYAVSCVVSPKVIHVASGNEETSVQSTDQKSDYIIVSDNYNRDAHWNEKARSRFYLVSLKDGSRKLIAQQVSAERPEVTLSPYGRFVLIKYPYSMQCFSYDIRTGNRFTIIDKEQIFVTKSDREAKFLSSDITWSQNNTFTIVDDYDIWQVDMTGQKRPVNLTAGYGRQHNLAFKFSPIPGIQTPFKEVSKQLGGYLLTAFNNNTKEWGFYKLKSLSPQVPELLSMGPFYYGGDNPNMMKAANANVYFVKRQSATDAENYFSTTDFKSFTRLSDFAPHKKYNWMTVEQVKWMGNNARACNGILFKPENFDSTRKYPVVVLIYNEFSSIMNLFMDPEKHGGLNFLPTSWLVSNGYLVFMPDLMSRKAERRLKETCDMLIPGVEQITRFPYVNKDKIGLMGASWGGMQTNYVITQTSLFAAAVSGAGFSENISDIGFSSAERPSSNLGMNESTYGVFPAHADRYIKESPLFSADKVTTPLLLKHNKDDGGYPFYQSLQYFRLLRRLGKKVWMLQYEKGDHGVRPGTDQQDMYTRMAQFFDHFLKDKPAPKWMTEGILPERKQIDSGLELEASNGMVN
jgi:dipeptidyl aminopeptidase/acylaminoacyl peptidase